MSFLSLLYSRILRLTRARSAVGALEVSDTVLRYASWKDNAWRFEEAALPAGTLVRGVVQNEAAFTGTLRALHDRVTGGSRRRLPVVVSLSSAPVYSQSFALPRLNEEDIEKAVSLNMQMNSPLALSESVSGWQVLQTTATQTEVLTASVSQNIVSTLSHALEAAGFLAMSLESRSFSVARTVRTWLPGFTAAEPYLVVLVDDTGLAVLILREGRMYFEYGSSWADIQGDTPSVSFEVFDAALERHVAQVINYHRLHSTAPFREALVIAPAQQDHITQKLSERFGLAARPVQVGEPPFPLPWLVAVGAAARGAMPRSEDTEINLIGISAQHAFQQEQVRTYLEFWRIMVPASLGVLLLTALAGYFFISRTRADLETQAAAVSAGTQITELRELEARAQAFNAAVASLREIQAAVYPKSPLAAVVYSTAAGQGIQLTRLYAAPEPQPNIISGFGPSEEAVLSFKRTLQADTRFTDVTLPITDIRATPQGISFSMTFRIAAPAAANTP